MIGSLLLSLFVSLALLCVIAIIAIEHFRAAHRTRRRFHAADVNRAGQRELDIVRRCRRVGVEPSVIDLRRVSPREWRLFSCVGLLP